MIRMNENVMRSYMMRSYKPNRDSGARPRNSILMTVKKYLWASEWFEPGDARKLFSHIADLESALTDMDGILWARLSKDILPPELYEKNGTLKFSKVRGELLNIWDNSSAFGHPFILILFKSKTFKGKFEISPKELKSIQGWGDSPVSVRNASFALLDKFSEALVLSKFRDGNLISLASDFGNEAL